MIDDKYTELIHREIDGANSPQESAQLKAYLAAHPEAQRFHDELASMSNLLREVQPVEPPAPLQDIVMYRLPNRYAAQPKTSLLATLREWFEVKINFKYAYVFAGGLTMGIVMYALLLQTTLQMPEDLNKISAPSGKARRRKILKPSVA
jgi:anti-sigma factor RsiW